MIKKNDAVNVQGHNKINGDFRKITKEKPMYGSYRYLQQV